MTGKICDHIQSCKEDRNEYYLSDPRYCRNHSLKIPNFPHLLYIGNYRGFSKHMSTSLYNLSVIIFCMNKMSQLYKGN